MKYLLPIFCAIFFVACFGINKDEISQNNSLKYPSWYLNPPLNDGNIALWSWSCEYKTRGYFKCFR
ncbi:hypothetical protein MASR2M54_21420 [Aliarcobacter cryaerophilus]